MQKRIFAMVIVSVAPAISYAQGDKNFVDKEEGDAARYVAEGTIEVGGSLGAGLQDDTWTIIASPTISAAAVKPCR